MIDIIIIGSVLCGVYWFTRKVEANEWNNGISRKSGSPWIPFDTDSSGATGYHDNHDNVLWK